MQAFELVVAAGQVDHQDLRVGRVGLQYLADRGQVFDAADIGHQAAAGAKLGERQLDDPPHLASGAADEHGVRRRQAGPGLGGLAQDWRQVRDVEPLGIAGDQGIVFGVHLDGIGGPARGDLRRLNRHRTAARADIPNRAGGTNVEQRQRDGAHLRRREQARVWAATGGRTRQDCRTACGRAW